MTLVWMQTNEIPCRKLHYHTHALKVSWKSEEGSEQTGLLPVLENLMETKGVI